jgi:hypothetical protein
MNLLGLERAIAAHQESAFPPQNHPMKRSNPKPGDAIQSGRSHFLRKTAQIADRTANLVTPSKVSDRISSTKPSKEIALQTWWRYPKWAIAFPPQAYPQDRNLAQV